MRPLRHVPVAILLACCLGAHAARGNDATAAASAAQAAAAGPC